MKKQWVLFCLAAMVILSVASLAMAPSEVEADPTQYSIGRLREATLDPRGALQTAAPEGGAGNDISWAENAPSDDLGKGVVQVKRLLASGSPCGTRRTPVQNQQSSMAHRNDFESIFNGQDDS